jgi:hypothetical protein
MSDQPIQSDTDLMQAFVALHGDAPPEEGSKGPARASMKPESETPPETPVTPEAEEEGEEGDEGFDEATLQALGLGKKEEPSSGETGDAGSPKVDLKALTEALGLEPDAVTWTPDGVRFKAKVDGQILEVSPEELRKGYQLQSHFTRQQETFLQQQREWEQAAQAREQQVTQAATIASQVLDAEEAAFKQKYTRNDWDTLRTEDPAEYAAMVADYNKGLQDIRSRRQQLLTGVQARQQQQAQEYQQRMAQHMQEQGAKLVETLGWKGEKEVQEGGKRLNEYMLAQGFTPQDLQGVYDHRAFVLAEKARQFDELQAKIAKARAKIQEAPRMPAGGAAVAPGDKGETKLRRDAQKRLKESGSLEDAAAVFRRLKVV